MGIKGLLPFLSAAQRDVNIASFRNQRAAIDAYCWLHRGAYSCALQLVMKTESCEKLPFIKFCMKRVNLLRQYNITPIVVFDGANLPMKADTETERRERRKSYLEKGKALLAAGKKTDAYDCFQKCVNVSPEMALAFIKELRREQIQVVVAPYEADAQLAYLLKSNLADFVITEDSDLLAFGCSSVLFKMNDNGDGKLIELQDIGKANKALVGFNPDSFRHLCILCGCDYLPSVPGIGPAKASKLMKRFGKDPYKVIRGLTFETGKVPTGYADAFRRADHTFLYQLVFDPVRQVQVHLNPLPPSMDVKELEYAGALSSPSKQVGLARGNINPITMEVMDTYSPSRPMPTKSASKSTRWDKSALSTSSSKQYPVNIQAQLRPLPVSAKALHDYKPPKRISEPSGMETMQDTDLISMYGKSGSSSLQTSLIDRLSPCQQQAEVNPQPGTLRNMFAVSSTTRVKSRFFAKESLNVPPAAIMRDKSGLAVLAEIEREGMASGSYDSGLGDSIGGSQLDTENQSQSEVSINLENHSVKKRLMFDGSNDTASSKRPRVDYDLPDKNHPTEENFLSCEEFISTPQKDGRLEEICTSQVGGDQNMVDLTEDSENSENDSPTTPKPCSSKAPPTNTAGCKAHDSPTAKARGGMCAKPLRAGLSRSTSSKTRFNAPKRTPTSGSDLRTFFGYQKRPSMTL